MRVIRKPELVTEILMNNVVWVKTGLVWDVLAPLLGEGLILANGEKHLKQRASIKNSLSKVQGIEAAIKSYNMPVRTVNLADEMLLFVETLVLDCLFQAQLPYLGPSIRQFLDSVPYRLLGFSCGSKSLEKLEEISKLPIPKWMPNNLTVKQKRDQLLTLYVAAVETTAASLTWKLCGKEELPIWFLPRQNILTGETVILLLSQEHMFGMGVRKCLGEHLANQITKTVLQTWRFEINKSSNLKPKFGLTRWPKKAIGKLVKLN
jgi:hypothetical protein